MAIKTMLTQLSRLANRSLDLAFFAPMLPFWQSRLKGKLMVYLYHRIDETGANLFLDLGGSPITPPEQFRQDLASLKSLHAEFIRIEDIPNCEFKADTFYVAITIDDGFDCAYQQAIPIANELGIPLTIFQCSAMRQGEPLIWEHQIYWLFANPELWIKFIDFIQPTYPGVSDIEVIRETLPSNKVNQLLIAFFENQPDALARMQQETALLYPSDSITAKAVLQGHEVGSHGHSHMKRASINDNEFQDELLKSKQVLSNVCNTEPSSFSYPFNSYTTTDHALVRESYQQIATVDGGAISAYCGEPIPRCTWPGMPKNKLRQRRWLYTGRI